MEESDYQSRLKSAGRNDQCPCGSGKKYKKCHLSGDERMEHEEFRKREEALKLVEQETGEPGNDKSRTDDLTSRKKMNTDTAFRPTASKYSGRKGIKSSSRPRRPSN